MFCADTRYSLVAYGVFLFALAGSAHAADRNVQLKAAVDAYHGGHNNALSLLASAPARHPEVRHALDLLRASLYLQSGRAQRAHDLAEGVLSKTALWEAPAKWVLAQALSSLDCPKALGLMRSNKSLVRWSGRLDYRKLKGQLIQSCASTPTLGPQSSKPGRLQSDGQILSDAQQLVDTLEYAKAIELLSAQLARGGGPVLRLRRAKLRYKFVRRETKAALADFRELCQSRDGPAEEACYRMGQALGRLGRVAEAVAAYADYKTRFPEGRHHIDARFFSGFLLYEHGRYKQALETFRLIKGPEWGNQAAWYAAWCLYLLGDKPAAAEALASYVALKGIKGSERRRGAYWRLQALRGYDEAKAGELAEELLRNGRLDWYGLLLHRQGYRPAHANATVPPRRQTARIGAGPRRQIALVKRLGFIGLPRFARQAMVQYGARMRASGLGLQLGAAALETGAFDLAIKETLRTGTQFLRGIPDHASLQLWRQAYPQGYSDLVIQEGARNAVDAALLFSFIRKESLFEEKAISHAHAVGLMQLLPRTGQLVMASKSFLRDGLPSVRSDGWTGQHLLAPKINVRLGAWYISAIQKRFRGQVALVAAAYNAGPKAVLQWIGAKERAPLDEFIEKIPFKEARNYVKRMYRNYATYSIVYGSQTLDEFTQAMPQELDLRVRPGVSF